MAAPASFARNVLAFIRKHELLRPGDRCAVAVSGGADSVALLRVMLELRTELGVVLSVVHFNHRIRAAASDADEVFVKKLAEAHNIPLHVSSCDVPARAKSQRESIETAARDARYSFFRQLISSGAVSKVMTAHTLDDQAETVLMRVVRGTGTAGLAGIYPQVKVDGGEIVRPLLSTRRCDIEDYLRELGQVWQEDATNQDVHYARNRVRHVLLPMLEKEFNPAIRQRLAELADIARVEEDYWDSILSDVAPSYDPTRLDAEALSRLPLAIQRRVIRRVGEQLSIQLDFETIDAIQHMGTSDARSIELPGGWRIVRQIERRPSGGRAATSLVFEKAATHKGQADYEYELSISGEVTISQTGTCFTARLVPASALPVGARVENVSDSVSYSGYNLSQLLDPAKLPSTLTVRNWRAGDHFWPAHTSGPKKVKELLQRRHITGLERSLWPVVVCGGEIVWMRGFPISEKFRMTGDAGQAVLIEERARPVGNNLRGT